MIPWVTEQKKPLFLQSDFRPGALRAPVQRIPKCSKIWLVLGAVLGALWAAPFATKHKEFKGFWSLGGIQFGSVSGSFFDAFGVPFWTPEFFRARFARPEIQAEEQASGSKVLKFLLINQPHTQSR